MTTRQIADSFPRQYENACGHPECARPEHRKGRWYVGLHSSEAKAILDALARKGLVGKISAGSAYPCLWYYLDEASS